MFQQKGNVRWAREETAPGTSQKRLYQRTGRKFGVAQRKLKKIKKGS
jgi:hypothetical protein